MATQLVPRWHFPSLQWIRQKFERSAKESVCSGNSAFTVGAAAMTAAGAVAASTRRKGRTSKAGTFSGRGITKVRTHRIDKLSQVCDCRNSGHCPCWSGPWWEGGWHWPWHHQLCCSCHGGSGVYSTCVDICGRVWVGVAYYINLVFVRFFGFRC